MRARFIDRRKNLTTTAARVRARTRTYSVVQFVRKIDSTLNVPRGEISGNWPYKVHISRLVTVIPFYSAGRSASAGRSLSLSLSLRLDFFPRSWRDIRRVGRPSSPSENWPGAVHIDRARIREVRVSRVRWVGAFGRKAKERKGSFVPVLVYIPKYRHLPPALTPPFLSSTPILPLPPFSIALV